MPNPGCGCKSCENDTAKFWPPSYNTKREWKLIAAMNMEDGVFFYWAFEWHCARSDGWGEWFNYGDGMV